MNIARMQSAFSVSKLHNMAQNINHQAALFLFFQNLVSNQPHKPFLLRIEQYSINYTPVYNQIVKRAADIVCNACFICTLQITGRTFRRNNNNRNIINPMILIHHCQHFEPVHLRHNNIQQQKGNLRPHLLKLCHRLFSVFRFQDLILIFKHIQQNRTIHLRIICN